MDYNSINTQWYSLEEKDVCEIDLKLGQVTFKDTNFNTKSLRMDSNTLIVAIYEALGSLVVSKDYETFEEKANYEILKAFESTILNFIETSEDMKRNWEK